MGKLPFPQEVPPGSVSDRRRFGRLAQRALICEHGPVLDLSCAGCRVLVRRVPKEITTVSLRHESGLAASVRAKVVWSRRIGFRRFVVGFEFLDITPNAARQLTQIATASAIIPGHP